MSVLLACDFDAADWAAWLPALQAALPGERLLLPQDLAAQPALREDIDVAIVANPPPGQLAGLPRLGLIQSLWAGVDRLLADPTLPAEVLLARMVDPAMNTAMAETALWAVLTLHRHFHLYARQQRAGVWQALPQLRADEIKVAVLGQGQMGGTVMHALRQRGYRAAGWRRGEPLEPVLADCRIVINLLPLTADTRGLIDAAFLARLPTRTSLVNLARGAHLVEADLLAALDAGQIAHAVLDVFHQEPLPPTHRFWRHPAVTLLPHAAAQTDPRSAARIAAAGIRAWREGRTVPNRVERSRGY